MAYYNPFRTGKSPRYPKKRGLFHCSCGPFRPFQCVGGPELRARGDLQSASTWRVREHFHILKSPIHRIHVWGIYLHFDDFNGTCTVGEFTWHGSYGSYGFSNSLKHPPAATFTLPHCEAPAKHHTIQQHDTSNAPIKTEVQFLKKQPRQQTHIKTTPSPASRSFNNPKIAPIFSNFGNQPTSKTPVFPGNPKKRLENLGFFQPPPRNSGP